MTGNVALVVPVISALAGVLLGGSLSYVTAERTIDAAAEQAQAEFRREQHQRVYSAMSEAEASSTLAEFRVEALFDDKLSLKKLDEVHRDVADSIDTLYRANANVTAFGSEGIWQLTLRLVGAHQDYSYSLVDLLAAKQGRKRFTAARAKSLGARDQSEVAALRAQLDEKISRMQERLAKVQARLSETRASYLLSIRADLRSD